jgi:hypothetical protein
MTKTTGMAGRKNSSKSRRELTCAMMMTTVMRMTLPKKFV